MDFDETRLVSIVHNEFVLAWRALGELASAAVGGHHWLHVESSIESATHHLTKACLHIETVSIPLAQTETNNRLKVIRRTLRRMIDSLREIDFSRLPSASAQPISIVLDERFHLANYVNDLRASIGIESTSYVPTKGATFRDLAQAMYTDAKEPDLKSLAAEFRNTPAYRKHELHAIGIDPTKKGGHKAKLYSVDALVAIASLQLADNPKEIKRIERALRMVARNPKPRNDDSVSNVSINTNQTHTYPQLHEVAQKIANITGLGVIPIKEFILERSLLEIVDTNLKNGRHDAILEIFQPLNFVDFERSSCTPTPKRRSKNPMR